MQLVWACSGEYNLRLGIVKELQPELVATHQGDARVLEGHAFIVEAAVSVGGRDIKPGINVYRFANRIPLLFEVHRHFLSGILLTDIDRSWACHALQAD